MQKRILILDSCWAHGQIYQRELPTATICTTFIEADKCASENDYDILIISNWLDGVEDSGVKFLKNLKARMGGNAETFCRKYKLSEIIVVIVAEYEPSGKLLSNLCDGLVIPFRQINWKGLKKCLLK